MREIIHLNEVAFRWVLQTSWQAVALAMLVFFGQRLLRERLSPAWRYGLWLLVVARLLLPTAPQSAWSIYNLATSRETVVKELPTVVFLPPPSRTEVDTSAPVPAPPRRIDTVPKAAPSKPIARMPWMTLASCAWLIGVVFCLVRLIWANARFRARISPSRAVEDEETLRMFGQCRAVLRINRSVLLLQTDQVETPAICAVWRKRLLLPQGWPQQFSPADLRSIFLHELSHVKRRDVEINLVVVVLQAFHWFNPFLWLAFARMRADREIATDALALQHVEAAGSLAYGETILKVVEHLSGQRLQAGLVGIAEGRSALRERFRAISQSGSRRPWMWAAATLAALLAGVGLTNARQPKISEGAPPQRNADTASLTHSSPATALTAIAGTIVDPDGRAAPYAQVVIYKTTSRLDIGNTPRLFNPERPHRMSTAPRKDMPWNYCTTDDQGRFRLDDLNGALFLLASSEKGFAQISTNQFGGNMTVRLEPWLRIDGTVWNYDGVFTNEGVTLGKVFSITDDWNAWARHTEFVARTDNRGWFTFPCLPEGQFNILAHGMRVVATVGQGYTVSVNIGGAGGRPVVGKFKLSDPNFHPSFQTGSDVVFCRFVKDPPRPPQGFKSRADYLAWLDKTAAERNFSRWSISYKVDCAADGSFRVEQVEPGAYTMQVDIRDWKRGPANGVWTYAGFDGFVIPAQAFPADRPRVPKPVDIGVVELSWLDAKDFERPPKRP